MLNLLLWLPLAVAVVVALAPQRFAGPVSVAGSLGTLGVAAALVADFDKGVPGLQHVVDESWIPDLGVRYQLGIDGISLFLVAVTALLWAGAFTWSRCARPTGRRTTSSCSASASSPPWARSVPRTCCCSSSSST